MYTLQHKEHDSVRERMEILEVSFFATPFFASYQFKLILSKRNKLLRTKEEFGKVKLVQRKKTKKAFR